ncbi:MAG: hypothetical protein ACK2U3_06375 [Anaerolineales bacterium]|jgi:hypothetical protein
MSETYYCGPLEVKTETDHPVLEAKVEETLNLYNVRWNKAPLSILLKIFYGDSPGKKLQGSYLESNRMWVDTVAGGLQVYFLSGGYGRYVSAENAWTVYVPEPENRGLVDIEDLMGLVLTTGWRKLGWAPMHAGAIAVESRCMILCAESGGGKSTLSAAMLHSGWGSLGDDKLLLRIDVDGEPELRALMHNFNLHPQTSQWFPEVGDLEHLPEYSVWTPKRRVPIGSIWPDQVLYAGRPTHLAKVTRDESIKGFKLGKLQEDEVLELLLRQTVIPKDRITAGRLLATLTRVSQKISGVLIQIGEDAYSDTNGLAELDWNLRQPAISHSSRKN